MRKWIVTVGGTGLLPFGPGTWGSLATSAALLLLYAALYFWAAPLHVYAAPFSWIWTAILFAAMLLFCALAVWLGPWAIARFEREDPGPFVLDEAAGICLTMLCQRQWCGWAEAIPVFAAFAAFRIFDITKPPPARQLERLPAGWGILLDDLMAAVYANLLCQAIFRLLLPAFIGR